MDKSGKVYQLGDLINFVYRDYRVDYPIGKITYTASGTLKSVIRWVKKGYDSYGWYCGHEFGADFYLNGVKIFSLTKKYLTTCTPTYSTNINWDSVKKLPNMVLK